MRGGERGEYKGRGKSGGEGRKGGRREVSVRGRSW